MSLQQLQPHSLWRHFQMLCDTPRPSGHERAVRDSLLQWAAQQGLRADCDAAGNLRIVKPASPGREGAPGVILQGHLDMVAQQRLDGHHCFTTDPLQVRVEDGWVLANGTTLGADNGLGVAAALAVLEDRELVHGPLEALFTIEEESSMRGALELRPDWLLGRLLLNLDSEDRGDVYVGCAGGLDVRATVTWPTVPVPPDWHCVTIAVTGLRGGHSGLDIDKGRGNAIRLLARFLDEVCRAQACRLIALRGGSLRNALPRDATATLALQTEAAVALRDRLQRYLSVLRAEYGDSESGLKLELVEQPAEVPGGAIDQMLAGALDEACSRRLVALLLAAPHGVEDFSRDYPGVVAASCNLGLVHLQVGRLEACLLPRALRQSALEALAARIRGVFELAGCTVTFSNGYPGWTPDPDAPLLALFQRVHESCLGQPARVKVIHAGLECGIIGARYPHLQMISFGPVIRGAHSPEERAEIQSVAEFWQLLCALLETLAQPGALPDAHSASVA